MSAAVVAPSPSNVIAAGAVWMPLCAFIVALRFYTRRVQGARLLLDDWLTIPALVGFSLSLFPRQKLIRLFLFQDTDDWIGRCFNNWSDALQFSPSFLEELTLWPLGVDRKALGYPTPPTTDATGAPRTNSPEIRITRQVR